MSADAAIAAGKPDADGDTYSERAFGFWLYLMTDAIIFALLFATYVVMAPNIGSGEAPKSLFAIGHTFGETMLLLFSSITFGFATLATFAKNKPGVLLWLAVTFALGLGFVAMEIVEFSGMIEGGIGPDRSGSASAFFTLVGTHGLHVSTGLLWILILGGQVLFKGLTVPVSSRLFRLGLFWHFLDIVWIGIFSVVYLPGIM
jgi:cytochrome o ubiquinol oxidase subunit 3